MKRHKTLNIKCKNCHCDCHCVELLHADEYGICTCDKCMCGFKTKRKKDGARNPQVYSKAKNVVR